MLIDHNFTSSLFLIGSLIQKGNFLKNLWVLLVWSSAFKEKASRKFSYRPNFIDVLVGATWLLIFCAEHKISLLCLEPILLEVKVLEVQLFLTIHTLKFFFRSHGSLQVDNWNNIQFFPITIGFYLGLWYLCTNSFLCFSKPCHMWSLLALSCWLESSVYKWLRLLHFFFIRYFVFNIQYTCKTSISVAIFFILSFSLIIHLLIMLFCTQMAWQAWLGFHQIVHLPMMMSA